jgi:hypothetical protein
VGREYGDFVDACSGAMTLQDAHTWPSVAANKLSLGGDTLWRALCGEWAANCLADSTAKPVVQVVQDALDNIVPDVPERLTRLPKMQPPQKPPLPPDPLQETLL